MTTDTKAVARWDAGTGVNPRVNGKYVLFTDHEQVVADLKAAREHDRKLIALADKNIANLRSALAAKSSEVEGLAKDAERWRYLDGRLLAADFTMDDCVGLTFELPAGSAVSANAGETVDSAMEKANDH